MAEKSWFKKYWWILVLVLIVASVFYVFFYVVDGHVDGHNSPSNCSFIHVSNSSGFSCDLYCKGQTIALNSIKYPIQQVFILNSVVENFCKVYGNNSVYRQSPNGLCEGNDIVVYRVTIQQDYTNLCISDSAFDRDSPLNNLG